MKFRLLQYLCFQCFIVSHYNNDLRMSLAVPFPYWTVVLPQTRMLPIKLYFCLKCLTSYFCHFINFFVLKTTWLNMGHQQWQFSFTFLHYFYITFHTLTPKVTNMYLNASNNIQRLSRKKNNENAQTHHVEVAILM